MGLNFLLDNSPPISREVRQKGWQGQVLEKKPRLTAGKMPVGLGMVGPIHPPGGGAGAMGCLILLTHPAGRTWMLDPDPARVPPPGSTAN